MLTNVYSYFCTFYTCDTAEVRNSNSFMADGSVKNYALHHEWMIRNGIASQNAWNQAVPNQLSLRRNEKEKIELEA